MSPLLQLVRRVRKFDAVAFARSKPFVTYWTTCVLFAAWANYAQFQRLKELYPDYEAYRVHQGGMMLDAKRQEFADVMRYNQMVSSMRTDLSRR